MSTKKKDTKLANRAINEVVLVTPSGRSAPGTIEPQSKSLDAAKTTLVQLTQDWTVINQQVVVLLDETNKTTTKTGFQLEEVSFKLGINAKGHIGFLAGVEAGGDASITLTFKRNK
jgi:hypothetical protein